MGAYLNPGNDAFRSIVRSDYVDKTGLIGLINKTIGTTKNLTCVSRPRRFGKSFAAQMLCAYYDKTCDSHCLFEKYDIAHKDSFEKYLNKFDVIYWDITGMKPYTDKYKNLVPFLIDGLTKEIVERYPDVTVFKDMSATLADASEKIGNKFIILIDEWDAPIRENPTEQEDYLEFLRSLFKNSGTTSKIFAAAYMTGILPIKKDENQSAVSDFKEFTMLNPGEYAPYVGFTENEVKKLCEDKARNYQSMKKWYDGYNVGGKYSIYNPYSVMLALDSGRYSSYWKQTSAAETLKTYIDMDQDGLQQDIVRLIAGESVIVNTDSFKNDVESFTCKDDVLTLMIHLGYLTYEEISDSYDEDGGQLSGLVHIPNEEVRSEFEQMLRKSKHKSLIELVRKSDELLKETLAGNGEAVAAMIQDVHETEYTPTYYNDEQSLRYVVKMAYISSIDQFGKVEELPTGRGIADVVFVPKRLSNLPALVVELKWNRSAESAINQIKEKRYPKVLEQFYGEIVIVGINYDEKNKFHQCKIEKIMK